MPAPQSPLELEDVRSRVDDTVLSFLNEKTEQLLSISPEMQPVTQALLSFTATGKRIRPIFTWWAWRGCGGDNIAGALNAAASLEFIQACALIHDDVMDKSDTRRGQPAIHRRFEQLHVENKWRGSSKDFGEATAILVGDLALTWADELYFDSGLEAKRINEGKPIYDLMRTEVISGQYLDIVQQSKQSTNRAEVLNVAKFKTAKYTIERPLHLGARWAGASDETIGALSRFGLPLGIAFQVRDDIMGVFGDPAQTGKPAGDDIREGKFTILIDLAYQGANSQQAEILNDSLGKPTLTIDEIEQVRTVIRSSGALDEAEAFISTELAHSLEALDGAELEPVAHDALTALAHLATHRSI